MPPGSTEYNIEIWNELTFGTHFFNINDYYSKDEPKVALVPAPMPSSGVAC